MENQLERKDKKTDLEIEVKQCSSMIFKTENMEKPFLLGGFTSTRNNPKLTIGTIALQSEKDVICKRTKEPCVLSKKPGPVLNLRFIDYSNLNRCPSIAEGSSKEIVVKYKVIEGKQKGTLFFYADSIYHDTIVLEKLKESIALIPRNNSQNP